MTVVGRPTAAGKVTVDDQTGERDELDRTHDLTTPDAGDGEVARTADPARGHGREPNDTTDAAPSPSGATHPVVQPRRSPAIWAIVVALVAVVVLVVTVGAQAGALALAAVLAAAGVCRALTPGDVVGLAVRSRTFDVLFYLLLAAAVAFLTQTTPDI